MKVIVFCPGVSGHGGMEAAIRNLLSGFTELGDEAHLVLLGGSLDEGWLDGLKYTQIGTPDQSRWKRLVQYVTGPVGALRSRPDVVICADLTTVVIARLARLLTGNWRLLIASWIHFPLVEMRMANQLHHVDLHLAITAETASEIAEKLPAHRERIFTVYNALDLSSSTLIPRPASPMLLYIGRLNYDDHKRVNDILEAVARLRGEWRLRIIGSPVVGFEEQGVRLVNLARELGIADRVEWLGWQDKPWEAAGEVTALVMSSQREAFGMVLAEACSHGVACISSACAGPMEIIREGENGWLYPVGDVPALAELIQAVLDHPETLPPQETIRRTIDRFSGPAVAERIKKAVTTVSEARKKK